MLALVHNVPKSEKRTSDIKPAATGCPDMCLSQKRVASGWGNRLRTAPYVLRVSPIVFFFFLDDRIFSSKF